MLKAFEFILANQEITITPPWSLAFRMSAFARGDEPKRLHHDGDRQEADPGRRVKVWRCSPFENENVSRQMNQEPLRLWGIRRDRIGHSS